MVTTNGVDPQLEIVDVSTEDATLTTEKQLEAEDLLKQLAERDAELAKLKNDLKSLKGRQRDGELVEAIEDLRAEVQGQRKLVRLYLDAAQSGETANLSVEAGKIETEAGRGQSQRQMDVRYDREVQRMFDAANDEDGHLLLNDAQASEITMAWKAALPVALRTGNFAALTEITLDASKLVARNARESIKTETKKVRDEAEARAKKQLEKAGVHDMDTGHSAGGAGGITTWAQAQKIKKISDISDSDYEKLRDGR